MERAYVKDGKLYGYCTSYGRAAMLDNVFEGQPYEGIDALPQPLRNEVIFLTLLYTGRLGEHAPT